MPNTDDDDGFDDRIALRTLAYLMAAGAGVWLLIALTVVAIVRALN